MLSSLPCALVTSNEPAGASHTLRPHTRGDIDYSHLDAPTANDLQRLRVRGLEKRERRVDVLSFGREGGEVGDVHAVVHELLGSQAEKERMPGGDEVRVGEMGMRTGTCEAWAATSIVLCEVRSNVMLLSLS